MTSRGYSGGLPASQVRPPQRLPSPTFAARVQPAPTRPLLFVGGSWHGRFVNVAVDRLVVEVQHSVMPQVPLERYRRSMRVFGPYRTRHEALELRREVMVLETLLADEIERMLGLLLVRWVDSGQEMRP